MRLLRAPAAGQAFSARRRARLLSEEIHEVDEIEAALPRGDQSLQIPGVVRDDKRFTPVDDILRTGAQRVGKTWQLPIERRIEAPSAAQRVVQACLGTDRGVEGHNLEALFRESSHDIEDRTFAKAVSTRLAGQADEADPVPADLSDQLDGIPDPAVAGRGAHMSDWGKGFPTPKFIDRCQSVHGAKPLTNETIVIISSAVPKRLLLQ